MTSQSLNYDSAGLAFANKGGNKKRTVVTIV